MHRKRLFLMFLLTVSWNTAGEAAETSTDFEPAGFVAGESVQAHAPDGTTISPPVSGTNPDAVAWSVRTTPDEEVVDISSVDPEHGKVWRLSDRADTGNLQTRPHSPQSGGFSGESTAIDDFGSESPTNNRFYASLEFRSATGTAQTDLEINVSGACGDDCRHGFVRIVDTGTGFDLEFIDTGDNSGGSSCASFPITELALGLSYTEWHTLEIEITFNDGFGPGGFGVESNDVVNLYVNGSLVHTGGSWETCYAYVGSGTPRGIDRLVLYRASTSEADMGGGLYFDNIRVTDQARDVDGDGVGDETDNCINQTNPSQENWTVGSWTMGNYDPGDLVVHQNSLWMCSSDVFVSRWCGTAGYEPGAADRSFWWSQAWTEVGPCGNPEPACTMSTWVAETLYTSDARVVRDGVEYACRGFPYTGWCGQIGFEPGVDPFFPLAWDTIRSCL